MQTELPLFRDAARLQGGDILETSLSQALCESACMVLVFIPPYFSATHRYCTREYAAMIRLEKERLGDSPLHGLIVPVVLRGFDQMPEELKQRLSHKFDEYSIADPAVGSDPKYTPAIRQIAHYISERCRDLQARPWNCNGFRLPSNQDVERFLPRLEGQYIEFPGRSL